MKPDLVNQPTAAPTRKLTATLVGMVVGAVGFAIAAAWWPALADVQVEGVGSLSNAVQLICGGIAGYMTRERAI